MWLGRRERSNISTPFLTLNARYYQKLTIWCLRMAARDKSGMCIEKTPTSQFAETDPEAYDFLKCNWSNVLELEGSEIQENETPPTFAANLGLDGMASSK